MTTVADKIQQQHVLLLKALRRYDPHPQHSGTIATPAFKTACSNIFGISDEDQEKIIDKLDPEGTGRVKVHEFLSTFDCLDPLGGISDPLKLGLDNNVMTSAPWEEKKGTMTAYNWDRVPPIQNVATTAMSPKHSRKKTVHQDDSDKVEAIESPTWRKVTIPRSLTDPSSLLASDQRLKYLSPDDARSLAHSRDIDPVLHSLASPDHGADGGKRDKPLLVTQSIDLTATGTAITRSNRFYHLKFPDTRHLLTTPPSGSASSLSNDSWMRKSDPTFNCFQRDDANKREAHLRQSKERFSWARSRESEIEKAVNEEMDKKKLAVGFRSMAKQRYEERAYLYDKAARREGMDKSPNPLFYP